MYENIEKVIRDNYGKLHIEETRYGGDLLAGFDIEEYGFVGRRGYEGIEIADCIETAASDSDVPAMYAFYRLVDYAEQYPAFLFVQGKNLAEVFDLLEKRAILWNQLSKAQQEKLLMGFVSFQL